MAERKVIQKYFPPDFDPSKLGRGRKRGIGGGSKLQTVRLMAPFSMRCVACGEYIYKGKKFNARKESTGEKYYNIQVLRFHIRCTRCSAEIIFKTDPKNMDYSAEVGAVRNVEPWRDTTDRDETQEDRLKRLLQEEADEEEDAMANLEAKTMDTKREMEIADALDEIRMRNARNEKVDTDLLLGTLHQKPEPDQESFLSDQAKKDDELARAIFSTDAGEKVKRKSFLEAEMCRLPTDPHLANSLPNPIAKKRRKPDPNALGIIVKKRLV